MESTNCASHGHLDGSVDASSIFFGARLCAAASDGAWELLIDVDESRIADQDLTILTLDQIECFVRLELQSLRERRSRLGMPRLALEALEAYAQLERYLFTAVLIRGGKLWGVPQGCALSVHFCNLAGWAWNVCMKKGTPACPYQRLP